MSDKFQERELLENLRALRKSDGESYELICQLLRKLAPKKR